VSGIKNWRSFAAILGGDYATADRLLAEATAVYEPKNEHYFMTWCLWLQAMMANGADRPLEAIARYEHQVQVAGEIGYLRGLVVAQEGLGDANVAAGRLEAAEEAFVHSVEVAEQMGMVRDMLNLMTKIAMARSAMGRHADATELLANVCASPISEQQAWTETEPIRDIASKALEEACGHLGDDTYRAAHERGRSVSFEAMVNDLLGRTPGIPSR
jgi:hypothetical protein